ncbi:MAG: hypothetical protein J6W10_06180, partial [Kiritimatiellae bacterium]|nr:hypothetical protein [Kiritimatiellia bacterium]
LLRLSLRESSSLRSSVNLTTSSQANYCAIEAPSCACGLALRATTAPFVASPYRVSSLNSNTKAALHADTKTPPSEATRKAQHWR